MKDCFYTVSTGVLAEENASHRCWSKKPEPCNYPPFSFDLAEVEYELLQRQQIMQTHFYSSVDSSFHIKHYIMYSYTGNKAQKEIQKCTYIERVQRSRRRSALFYLSSCSDAGLPVIQLYIPISE